VTLKAKTYKGG